MRVLAVGAHADDLEILCAGTLARYVARGDEVVMAVVTDGAAGHTSIEPAELARIREQEARRAAAVIGAELLWLGFSDGLLFDDASTRLAFINAIRAARADAIITHAPNDYHPDHRMVSQLVFEASFMTGFPNIKTDTPPHPGALPLFYMDTLAGNGFLPTEYVDITDTFDIKRQMLACHESQIAWMSENDNLNLGELVESVAKVRGFQSGVRYAEGFRRECVWLRASPKRLLP